MADPTVPPSYAELTSPAFEAAVSQAREVLRVRYERLVTQWSPERYAAWSFDQAEGILRFTNPDGSGLRAPAQLLGSYDESQGTWMWAWHNRTVTNPSILVGAVVAREWGMSMGFAPMTTGVLRADTTQARAMICAAAVTGGADGIYYGAAPGAPAVALAFTGLAPIGAEAGAAAGAAAPRGPHAAPPAARPKIVLLQRTRLSDYVRQPRVLYARAPQRAGSPIVPATPELDARLPMALRDALQRMEDELSAAGFGPAVHAAMRGSANRVILVERADGEAIAHAILAVGKTGTLVRSVTLFSHFSDGVELQTGNARLVTRTPSRPYVRFVRLPDVGKVQELWRIHAFRVAERARTVPVRAHTRGADPFAWEEAKAREINDFWVARGYYRWAAPDALRFTMRGATLAAWRGLFPWKQLTERRERREAAALLARYRAARAAPAAQD